MNSSYISTECFRVQDKPKLKTGPSETESETGMNSRCWDAVLKYNEDTARKFHWWNLETEAWNFIHNHAIYMKNQEAKALQHYISDILWKLDEYPLN